MSYIFKIEYVRYVGSERVILDASRDRLAGWAEAKEAIFQMEHSPVPADPEAGWVGQAGAKKNKWRRLSSKLPK